MKHIAFCNDSPVFKMNKILDKEWAKRFPGALWVSFFDELVRQEGYSMATGDMAISHVRSGYWKPEEVLVIQESLARSAETLIRLGAKPWILICLESPLVDFVFYDSIKDIAPGFPHRILFPGSFKGLPSECSGSNHQVRFPAYNLKDLRAIIPWNDRKFMVMVAANKFFKGPFKFHFSFNKQVRYFYNLLRKALSPTRRLAVSSELHTKRLEAIEYFGQNRNVDVYGTGWTNLQILPKQWQRRLGGILPKLDPQMCEYKNKTIAGYKFAICFENVAYAGYFTEKIVDSFVAGVIPIYLGATDIEKYIPKDAYIDMRQFTSYEVLDKYLGSIPETEALRMISTGREYLQSPKGKLHNYEGFAEFIRKLLPERNKA